MAEQYTPTTSDVEEAFAWSGHGSYSPQSCLLNRQAFSRWLAAHDAQLRAQAFRDAAEFLQPWAYDRPYDWKTAVLVDATSADRLRIEADRMAEGTSHE